MAEKLIFTSLKRELKGKDELMIVGGTIAEGEVIKWLGEFSGHKMPWRMWEWVNDFRLEHESFNSAFPKWLGKFSGHKMLWRLWEWVNDFRLEHESFNSAFPTRLAALERVRLFGEGGDLTVRRDGELFRWHFIGPNLPTAKKRIIPAGWQTCHDYWQKKGNESQKFACFAQKALLWGAYNQELKRWYDNRVGFAHLAYPIADLEGLLQQDKKGHVYAYYREYLDAGQVAFVWMYKLGERAKVMRDA